MTARACMGAAVSDRHRHLITARPPCLMLHQAVHTAPYPRTCGVAHCDVHLGARPHLARVEANLLHQRHRGLKGGHAACSSSSTARSQTLFTKVDQLRAVRHSTWCKCKEVQACLVVTSACLEHTPAPAL